MAQKNLTELFPDFQQISDPVLRDRSAAAMRLAMEEGGWTMDTIPLCPVTLNWKKCDVPWVEHVTDVTKMCLLEYDAMSKYFARHGVEMSRDIVASGALLHDIGKLTEFSWKNHQVVHSDHFELMRHPLSGAILAAEAGLPDKLVHLIAVHSFEGEHSYQTAESDFVRSIDMFVFKNSVRGLAKITH